MEMEAPFDVLLTQINSSDFSYRFIAFLDLEHKTLPIYNIKVNQTSINKLSKF